MAISRMRLQPPAQPARQSDIAGPVLAIERINARIATDEPAHEIGRPVWASEFLRNKISYQNYSPPDLNSRSPHTSMCPQE